jgi:hypothetical protein
MRTSYTNIPQLTAYAIFRLGRLNDEEGPPAFEPALMENLDYRWFDPSFVQSAR